MTRSDRQSAWWTLDGGSWYCRGDREQDRPQEKEMQNSKMVVWGGLTNSCEKKRSEGKGEKERYTHLNADGYICMGIYIPIWMQMGIYSQRIARRDKKALFSDQCKEIEENNRMGKTRDLFKKIRDTKGTFHAKVGTIKDRNGMDLTEAEDIKRLARIHRRTVQKRSSWPR